MLKKKILDPDPDPGATDPFSTLANLGRAVRGHGRIKNRDGLMKGKR